MIDVSPSPSENGKCVFDKIIYASSGVKYDVDSYKIFEAPLKEYEINKRINLSSLNLPMDLKGNKWPFGLDEIPINGILYLPQKNLANELSPIALFIHGNHNPQENSTPGYEYLCSFLASKGIASATIDTNFLNGNPPDKSRGENAARSIVLLEHLKQFKEWNNDKNHPLHGKLDLNNIMIVGHSRGGEAVTHAALFNNKDRFRFYKSEAKVKLDGSSGFGPYNFGIKMVVALAPTHGQYKPPGLPDKTDITHNYNYFIIHGSRDRDVVDFQGYKTFDKIHSEAQAEPKGFRGLVWINEGCHNYFNASWQGELELYEKPNEKITITRKQQEMITKAYIGALAETVLLGNQDYVNFLYDHKIGIEKKWLPADIKLVTQYEPKNREYIQHFEEKGDKPEISSSFKGDVNYNKDFLSCKTMFFKLGKTKHLYQKTKGLELHWKKNGFENQGIFYKITLTDPYDIKKHTHLAIDIGRCFESVQSNPNPITFELKIINNDANEFKTDISVSYCPDDYIYKNHKFGKKKDLIYEPKTVMQTVAIPLSELKSVNAKDIKSISLELKDSGKLYIDKLRLADFTSKPN